MHKTEENRSIFPFREMKDSLISRFSYTLFIMCYAKICARAFILRFSIDKFLSRSEESNKLMGFGKFMEYLLYIYTYMLILADQIESFVFG